ncbi:MAG: PAS domain S-box protein, partial [Caldilineaceae bacterium]
MAEHSSPAEQLAQILDSMQDAIMSISLPDHRLIYKSASFEQVFGYPVQKFVDDPTFFKQIMFPDDVEMVIAARNVALRDGFVEFDHRIVLPSGEVRWLHRRVHVHFDAVKRPIQVIDTARDITAGKQYETTLRESEEKYRSLLESSDSVIVLFVGDGTVLYANEVAARPYGLAAQQLIGRTIDELFPPELAARQLASIRAVITEGTGRVIEAVSIVAGQERWYRTSIQPVRGSTGTVRAALINATDITASKTAEAALRRSEAALQEANRLLEQRIRERTAELQEERNLLRTMIDAMSEGLVVQGRDGAIQMSNRAAARILGLTAEQMIGRTSLDPRWRGIHEDGSPFGGETHPAMLALHTGAPQVNVVMGVHKPDDTLTWILINSQPLTDAADPADAASQQPYAAITTFADITALKEAEAVTEAALAHERELGELKSRFVSMASHEFRNPLAGILATAETLALLWDRMDKAKVEDRLKRIQEQALRLNEITEDILQLTRLQTGRSKFTPVPGDLDALCAHVVKDLDELPGNQGRIHYDCAQRLMPAFFDPRLLQQAISNLLHNALKYSPPDRSVRVTLAQAANQVTLRVTDEGIGIPAEDLQHLFQPFHRAANVGAVQGTGLGLAIVKEAVELHGGTISVESQVGEGTTF